MMLLDDESCAFFPPQRTQKKIKRSYTYNASLQQLGYSKSQMIEDDCILYDFNQLRTIASNQEQQIFFLLSKKKKKEAKLLNQWIHQIQSTPSRTYAEEENHTLSSYSDTVSCLELTQKQEIIESRVPEVASNQDIDHFFISDC